MKKYLDLELGEENYVLINSSYWSRKSKYTRVFYSIKACHYKIHTYLQIKHIISPEKLNYLLTLVINESQCSFE